VNDMDIYVTTMQVESDRSVSRKSQILY